MRITIPVILLAMILCGCWSPQKFHEVPDGLRLSIAGDAHVDNEGFQLTLWFDVLARDEDEELQYRETIQRIRMNTRPDFEGVETHRQPMWFPDFQIFVRGDDGTPRYVKRTNTVSPGTTKDAPWATLPGQFKGVCMISGFLDEEGEPVVNRNYFSWGGKQGGEITEERLDLGITYTIEWWSAEHPDVETATLRLAIPGEGIEQIWTDDQG